MTDAGSGPSSAEPGPAHPGSEPPEAAEPDAGPEAAATQPDVTEEVALDHGDGAAPTPLAALSLSPEEWRIVAVAGVEMELPSPNPEVVLHEAQHPWRELRIPVGLAEGTAIAYAFERSRRRGRSPTTLVTEILDRHDVSVEAVRITVRRGQLFFAELDTMGPRGRRVVPCRPSDAIALALRQRLPTPILVAEWVFTGADAPVPLADAPDGAPTTPT